MTQAATLAQLASSGALSADTSGNVGIGIVPNGFYKLQVNGQINGTSASITGANSGAIYVQDSNTAFNPQIQFIGTNRTFQLGTGNSASGFNNQFFIYDGTAPATRMLIDQNGSMLVGGTSIPAAGSGAKTYFTIANGYAQAIQRTGSDGPQVAYINAAGNLAGRIDVSGTTCSLFSVSDYRLKENIQPVVGALNKVAQLKPCTYTWKESGNEEQGFIAHELKEVIPSCVSGDKDAVDASGNIIPQAVSMNASIISTLTAAIQELKAELDVCKAEIAALKGV